MLHDRTRLKKLNTASYQIIIILAVWSCAYVLQKLLNLPVASGVLGFLLLLFFIPPVVGVIQYQDLLIASGWQILLVILISTALVMMVSVYSVRLLLKPPELNQEPKLEDQYD